MGPHFGLLFVVQTNRVAQSLSDRDIHKSVTAPTEHKFQVKLLQSTYWLKERQSDLGKRGPLNLDLAANSQWWEGLRWLKERHVDFCKKGPQAPHMLKRCANFAKNITCMVFVLQKRRQKAFAIVFFIEIVILRSLHGTPKALAFLWRFSVRFKSVNFEFKCYIDLVILHLFIGLPQVSPLKAF